MKLSHLCILAIVCASACSLSACAGGPSGGAPSLSAPSPQTGRVPSPGNIRATEMNQSSRMTLPTAQ